MNFCTEGTACASFSSYSVCQSEKQKQFQVFQTEGIEYMQLVYKVQEELEVDSLSKDE